MTDQELEILSLKAECESVLRMLVLLAAQKRPSDEAAWWLCANHARYIIDHPLLATENELIERATNAGGPPTGRTWEQWFNRVRAIHKKELPTGK